MEILIARLLGIPIVPILILFYIIGLFIGFFLIIKPTLGIGIQQKFYAKINWKMTPISMSKEVRNTRLMGWLLIILLLAILVFILAQKVMFL